eukprot:7391930-Prymnesium_polylepis.1
MDVGGRQGELHLLPCLVENSVVCEVHLRHRLEDTIEMVVAPMALRIVVLKLAQTLSLLLTLLST